jgi:C-terminal processing protease CtpA/Prc
MIIEPKAALATPFRADASGLRLRCSGPNFREFTVAGVVEDSPAGNTRLRQGDRLIEIAGKSAGTVSLGEVLELFKRHGDTIPLKLKPGDQTVEVSLRLRALI